MGLPQGEGRLVIKSRGPSRAEAGLGEGRSWRCLLLRERWEWCTGERVCAMRCEASWVRHWSVKAKRLDCEVRMYETR